MATNAAITAAITEATDLGLTPSQMVAILDRAIAAAHVDHGGLPAVTYSTGTRSRTISLRDAMDLRRYYAGLGTGGGFVFIGAEFGQ